MVVTGYNYLSNLYEHWLNDAQPMEFFKTSFYEQVVGGLIGQGHLFILADPSGRVESLEVHYYRDAHISDNFKTFISGINLVIEGFSLIFPNGHFILTVRFIGI